MNVYYDTINLAHPILFPIVHNQGIVNSKLKFHTFTTHPGVDAGSVNNF